MAVLLRLPERLAGDPSSLKAGRPASGMTADIVILPCIRRERIGQGSADLSLDMGLPAQRHA